MNLSENLLATPLSRLDRVLAEAYQNHLVSELTPGGELLIENRGKSHRSTSDQELFQAMLRDGLLQPCAFNAPISGLPRTVYSVSNSGMQLLKNLSNSLIGSPVITEAQWTESRMMLCWDDPQSVWDSFQGQIFCRIEDDFGGAIANGEVLADVDLLRLNGTAAKASGLLLEDVINSIPGLQGYDNLHKGTDGDAESLEELPRILGLVGASSCSLILINFIKIRPLYLGAGMGSRALRKLLTGLAPGGGVAALSPHPLQFGTIGPSEMEGNEFEKARKALSGHYRRLGFIDHPFSKDLMVCDIHNKKLGRVPLH